MKKLFFVLLVIFIGIQFIKPAGNISTPNTFFANDISVKYPVPENVRLILQTSCYDCHSNNTLYPWYSKIQPVSWWLNNHITEGKGELNFNEFSSYRIRKQYRKLDKIIREVKEDEMPLSSYTFIHKNAVLTKEQKDIVIQWATQLRTNIQTSYPVDSLEKK